MKLKLILGVASVSCLVFGGVGAAVAQPIVTGDLTVYYSFDEFVDEVPDGSGNNLNGEVFGNVVLSPDAKRGAGSVFIDSIDSPMDNGISIGGCDRDVFEPCEALPAELIPTTGFTIATWVKVEEAIGQDQSFYQTWSADGSFVTHGQLQADGQIRMRLRGQLQSDNINSTDKWGIDGVGGIEPYPVGEWMHLVGTYSQPDNEVKFYYNGDLIVDMPADGNAGNIELGDWGQAATIGIVPDSRGRQLYGRLDEYYVFHRAITQEEVGQLFNLEEPGGPPVVVNTGVDTTLAQAGLGGPDAPHGGEGQNPDGVERWEWDGSDGGGVNQGLLWFDIPQNALDAFGDGTATLGLHVDNNGNAGTMHRVTTDWLTGPGGGDDVTWNNMPGGPGIVPGQNAEATSNATFPDSIGMAGQVLEVDVTEDVKAWAGGEPNYGWGFVPVGNDGAGMTSFEHMTQPVPTLTLALAGGVLPQLQAGDADQDLDFDQFDLIQVQQSAKYLTGQAATWGEGDWNGAPGGNQGSPPAGNGFFDQLDIIQALNNGLYFQGPYAALAPGGSIGDGQTSITYNPTTGELGVDAPAGVELTSVNIDSAAGVFTGAAAENLGGSFDNDADNNIFKATFGSSFGSLSFGNVAQPGLSQDFVLADLTVVGSLAGGGALGNVDLVYVPEPSTWVLLSLGLVTIVTGVRRVKRDS